MEVFDLNYLLNQLNSSIKELCQAIRSDSYPSRFVQNLSFSYEVDGVFMPPSITGEFKGSEATSKACEIISQYYRVNGQPLLSVHRAPGFIRVNDSCIDLVKDINNQKNALKDLLTGLPRREKSALIKSAAPGIILKELYRNIHITNNPSKINASWVVSGSSMSKITAKQILDTITYKKDQFLKDGRPTDFLTSDFDLISSYDGSHEFYINRPTQPHIKYNVKVDDGTWKNIPAHLPLLYTAINEPTVKPIGEIGSIRNFDRSKPSGKVYLIEWLGILK